MIHSNTIKGEMFLQADHRARTQSAPWSLLAANCVRRRVSNQCLRAYWKTLIWTRWYLLYFPHPCKTGKCRVRMTC